MDRLFACMALIVVLLASATTPGTDRAMAAERIMKPQCANSSTSTPGRITQSTVCRAATATRARQASPARHDYWSAEPSMLVPTAEHNTTLLTDGRLLVTGGRMTGFDLPPIPWTEIYNPHTSSWSFGPRMHMGRVGATATRLQDGRVLVVGGLGARWCAVATAEIFDPVTNIWTMAASLPQPRVAQSASVLPDGRVLIVGGVVKGALTRTTVLYDPALDRWSPSRPTHFAHGLQSSVTLPDDRVMIAGGYGGGAEVYQPRNSSWTGLGSTPFRTDPVLIVLTDGTVLMVSGTDRQRHDEGASSVFNPSTHQWMPTGSLLTARNGATGTLLQNGGVLVTGGGQVSGTALASTELFNPVSRTWSRVASMHTARKLYTATPLNDQTVLVCGGINRSGVLDSCERYHL